MASLYPLLPLLSGLVILAVVTRDTRLELRLIRHGVRAKGRVIGYRETSTASRMVVQFRTEDGREVHAEHENTGWTASRAGEIVTVSYDPETPELARIVSAPWLSHWVRGMFAALGAILVAAGVLLGYLAWDLDWDPGS
ncbi:DUF3592 domain-containing protein [Nocardiopsis changdeensis]|uniref:DUF3592 domain-containing protein n=1 Tax=Nocardiopsis changdeensis TaxID=2831969 RepID=A0ABX8BHV0_9ACTN|nr:MULTISPECIES: DUF3592 domain-containing protein [Nocardiopsis]QUX21815.1 DUF3592 domain-containing protein [Nocardiopsis changdeensis]QYX37750.1 DUF3592 domain-containing protein [Nocardiopsis sp. MT53]